MGTNMYPSSALLGQNKDASLEALPVDELIEKADGFAGVFPGMAWIDADLPACLLSMFAFLNVFLVMQSTNMRS
jgi:hypothetical protein